MCEISALECKQTETKEHEVEIGLVSKTGEEALLPSKGIINPSMRLHNNANRGTNSPHSGNRFHTERGGLGKEAYRRDTEILHLVLLDLEPSFLKFFSLQVSASWGIQSSGASLSQHRNLWPAEEKRLFWGLP